MKHKTLWHFISWVVTLSIFEIPLFLLPIEEFIGIKFMGINNFVFIILIDFYAIASLFASALAYCGVEIIDNLIVTKKESSN